MEDNKKLTCITCKSMFDTTAEQAAHYKSDFHRFNLKRKLVNLPSVTLEAFNTKVEALKKADEEEQSEDKTFGSCKPCGKTFGSEGAYNTHMSSTKHKQREVAYNEEQERKASEPPKERAPKPERVEITPDMTVEEVIEAKLKNAVKLDLDQCMFCMKKSTTTDKNVEHMEKEHGFFIPDREYMRDLDGFLKYLGQKISVGNVCLWCNDRSPYFVSIEAVQNHMRDLAHCKIRYEGEDEEEYADYYEFEAADHKDLTGNIEDASDYEITFKDGKTIGHRSLDKYYKQVYRPTERREIVLRNTFHNQQRQLGWHGTVTDQNVDKLAKAYEFSKANHLYDTQLGIRSNFLKRFRKENVTTRNSGR